MFSMLYPQPQPSQSPTSSSRQQPWMTILGSPLTESYPHKPLLTLILLSAACSTTPSSPLTFNCQLLRTRLHPSKSQLNQQPTMGTTCLDRMRTTKATTTFHSITRITNSMVHLRSLLSWDHTISLASNRKICSCGSRTTS